MSPGDSCLKPNAHTEQLRRATWLCGRLRVHMDSNWRSASEVTCLRRRFIGQVTRKGLNTGRVGKPMLIEVCSQRLRSHSPRFHSRSIRNARTQAASCISDRPHASQSAPVNPARTSRERCPSPVWCARQGALTRRCKSSTHPARGSVSRTARVSIARWDPEEAGGKTLL